jgi:MoaA/NifB/PqqE/SkfB family radical SAM enzyme
MNPFVPNKILAHLPVLNSYVAHEKYAPIQVEIDLTNYCASACPWCAGYLDRVASKSTLFSVGDTPNERLSSSLLKVSKLLEELAEYGVKAVTWTGGGDPTHHRGLQQIIEFAGSLGLKQSLITHGMNDVSHLIHDLEWVRFSIDAATEKGYEQQHGKPQHFFKVLENCSKAAGRKHREGLDVTVGVGFLTHENIEHEIVPFAKLWTNVPVDYIQYRPLEDSHGQKFANNTISARQLILDAKKEDARVVWSESKYQGIFDNQSGQTNQCHGIFFETAISADGYVYTCCHHKGNRKYAIGNLAQESFADIWSRHLTSQPFCVTDDCPPFCRHYGTNKFIENDVLANRTHPDFI